MNNIFGGGYNPYSPAGSPQQFAMNQMQDYQQRMAMSQQPQQMQLIRVTGIDGAKAYQMPPNSVVPLFDADNDIMYVKSTDGAGFPTIRTFTFQPVENPTAQDQQYVTRAEFKNAMMQLKEAISDGQQPVRKSTSKSAAATTADGA